MNVYFTGAFQNQFSTDHYEKIISHLKSRGLVVYSRFPTEGKEEKTIIDTSVDTEQWIKSCDFLVADASDPSVRVGYEISQAMRFSKPILLFYAKGGRSFVTAI